MPELRIAAEAFATTPLAALLIHLLPPARLCGSGYVSDAPGKSAMVPPRRAAEIVDAVLTLLHARCLTKALVLRRILARRGVSSGIVVGVASDAGSLYAHAWLEAGGEVLIGAGRREYAPLWRVQAAPVTPGGKS